MFYLDNDVELIDIYTSRDRNNDKPILTFVFDRNSSKRVFDLWCKREAE